jgi:hypothetical protein
MDGEASQDSVASRILETVDINISTTATNKPFSRVVGICAVWQGFDYTIRKLSLTLGPRCTD